MIYFLSDFHLGSPNYEKSLVREKKIVSFLDSIKNNATEIYLMGDVFDFWFEYNKVIPKGFVRLLGKLAELSDAGIKLHYFTGNHDMWVFDYFKQELNCTLYRREVRREINGKKFFLAHGDGLGSGDFGYKFIKYIFASKICQWLFARLHPNFGISIAQFWSGMSRNIKEDLHFRGEKEWLITYSRNVLKNEQVDYFLFGHRHIPIDFPLSEKSRYINLGEWITHFSYAVFDGKDLSLKYYRE